MTRGDAMEGKVRRFFKRIPEGPRCKLCAAPFAGVGAPLMRLIGKRPSDKNPSMCSSCFDFMIRHHGGAEIDCTLLFADIRGSTAMAERMSPAEFRGRLDRFYATATAVVFEHDGGVDKFVGDESHTELTAVGDTVNVTSRLASAAEAGEVLFTANAAVAAGLDPGLERHSLQLKGKQEPTDVVILTVRS